MADDPYASLDLDSLVKTATSVPPSTSYVGDTIKKVEGIRKQEDVELGPIREQIKTDAAKGKAEADAKTPKPADLQPWTAKPPEQNPIQAFGAFGSIFGILASAATHQPWQSSMNAATAAMNAVKANDAAAYKEAYQAWKDNTDLMLKTHDAQYKDFQAAMEKRKTDVAESNAMLTTLAAKYGDHITDAYKEAGLMGQLNSAWESRQKAALGILEVMPKIEEQHQTVTAVQGLQAAREELRQTQQVGDPSQIEDAQKRVTAAEQNIKDLAMAKYPYLAGGGTSVAAQKATAITQGFQEFREREGRDPDAAEKADIIQKIDKGSATNAKLDEKTLGAMADQYLAGDKSVVQGLGYGNTGAENRVALRTAIQKEAERRGMSGRDITTAMAEFEGLKAGERVTGQRTANVGLAVAEAEQLVPPALKASAAVPRGQFLPFNVMEQAVRRNTSSVEQAQLVAATNTLLNVYVRAVSPTGVPTDTLRQHAYALLDSAQSPEVYAGVIKQLQIEMDAARRAPPQVKQELSDLASGKVREKDQTGAGGSSAGPAAKTKTIGGVQYFQHSDGKWYEAP